MNIQIIIFNCHIKEDDYEVITDQYKSAEGSLEERKAVIKALRQSGGLWSSNRFPASLNEDMFYQMTDLDTGIYGKPYNVSLFLHVSLTLVLLFLKGIIF